MNSFKRCGTAIALVMAGSVPAFAQDTTEMVLPDRVLLAIEGTNSAYRVPLEVAVNACPDVVQEEVFAALEAGADVVYCTIAETVVVEQGFAEIDGTEFFEDMNEADESGDDDGDDEESGDNGLDGGTEGTEDDADGDDDIDVNLDGTDDTEGSPDDDELIDDGDDDTDDTEAGDSATDDTETDVDGGASTDTEG